MAAVTTTVIGVGGAVASAVMSFDQAAKQSELAERAERTANKARKDARQRLEKDFYEGLTVPMDAYEQEFEQQLAGQQTAIEALQEGDVRNLAAGVGRVGALANQAREKTRIDMGQDLFALDKLKADSKTDLNQQLASMDLAFATEQNQRKRDAEAARAQAIQSGVQSIQSGLTTAAEGVALYPEGAQSRRTADLQGQLKGVEGFDQLTDVQQRNVLDKISADKDMYKKYMDFSPEDYIFDVDKSEFIFRTKEPKPKAVYTPIKESDYTGLSSDSLDYMINNPYGVGNL